jgi:hypothetical protein
MSATGQLWEKSFSTPQLEPKLLTLKLIATVGESVVMSADGTSRPFAALHKFVS